MGLVPKIGFDTIENEPSKLWGMGVVLEKNDEQYIE